MEPQGKTIIGAADVVGFWRRACARLVDTVFGLFLGLFVGVVLGVFLAVSQHLGLVGSDWPQRLGGLSVASVLLSMVGNVLYHTLCEGLHGATLGKLVCGLRVVRLDGRAVGLGAAFVRSLWFLIDALFFGLVAHGEMKRGDLQQRLGDKRAKTVVVRAWGPGESLRPGGLAFFLAFSLGVVCWGAMGLVGGLLKVL